MANGTIELDNKFVGGSYTPTITGGTGFTYDNVVFNYYRMGKLLIISGRFVITNAGSAHRLDISLPPGSGLTQYGLGGWGMAYSETADANNYIVRCLADAVLTIVKGASGDNALPAFGTGYKTVFAVIPMQ